MKSAPASVTILHMRIFSSSVSRQVSMMTLRILPLQAFLMASISLRTFLSLPALSRPILMTISISSAPLAMASVVSNTLTAVVVLPLGKPMTVQIFILSPTYSFALRT